MEDAQHDLLEHGMLGSVQQWIDGAVGKQEDDTVQEEVVRPQHDEDAVGQREEEADAGDDEEVLGDLNLMPVDALLTDGVGGDADDHGLRGARVLGACGGRGNIAEAGTILLPFLKVTPEEIVDYAVTDERDGDWPWVESGGQ